MSCPDWPKCYGLWWPWPESRVAGGYMVDGTHYQAYQVALEWGHRLLAMLTGYMLLGITVISFLPKYRSFRIWPIAILSCVVLAVQVKLGGVTVWYNNVPWSVALHLGNALIFFAALLWLRRKVALVGQIAVPPSVPTWLKGLFIGFAGLVLLIMMVGATVSSSYAGGICGGLPSCGGMWWPQDNLQQVHMIHRAAALAVFALSIVLMICAKKVAPELRKTAKGLHILVLVQAVFGIITLYSFSHYPSWYQQLSLIHLGWGVFVWMGAVGSLLTLRYGKAGSFHER